MQTIDYSVGRTSKSAIHGWRRSRGRIGKSALLVLGIALGGCRPSSPNVQPARIVSGSMAPRYYGEHWEVTCDDCFYSFRIGVEHPPLKMQAVCPNCGFSENAVDEANVQPGMSVSVQPRSFAIHPPRRWEVVAFHEPNKDRVAVKRIIGLPGERIAIRDGEIFADGVLVRKSFANYLDMAQLVCHPDYMPSEGPVGFRPTQDEQSRWRAFASDNTTFTLRGLPADVPDQPFAWLEYRHRRNSAFADTGDVDVKIRDDDAYNQGLARQLNMVRDVSLTCGISMSDGDEFRIRLLKGEQPIFVALRPNENTVTLWQGETMLSEAPTSTPLAQGAGFELSVAMVDGQIFVVIDDNVTLRHELPLALVARANKDLSLAFGNRRLDVSVVDPVVYRDVYYLNPPGRADDWEMQTPLAADEYFLLGDNAPISVDSRHYGAVKLSEIIGSVEPREESTAEE